VGAARAKTARSRRRRRTTHSIGKSKGTTGNLATSNEASATTRRTPPATRASSPSRSDATSWRMIPPTIVNPRARGTYQVTTRW
jgi:hypothetical protein